MAKLTTEEIFKIGLDNGSIPALLYKYRTVDQTLQFLNNPAIYFSDAATFNDPFEFQAVVKASTNAADWYKVFRSERRDHASATRLTQLVLANSALAKKTVAGAFSNTQRTLGVYCLSAVPDSLLMWAHYAKDHTGACLCFRMAGDLTAFNFPKAIDYSDRYPVITYPGDKTDAILPLFHKSSHWAYEQEYRIIRMDYQGLQPVKQEGLAAIIFGARCSADDRQRIRQAAAGFPGIQFLSAALSSDSYKLNIS